MVHENSRPSESLLCLLCIARFDDGKWYTVPSTVTKCQSPERFRPKSFSLCWCVFPPVSTAVYRCDFNDCC